MTAAVVNDQLWWYLARASGIVAWLLLTASVLWGIVLATDLFAAHRRPAWLLDLHRWLGGLTVGFTVLHMMALFADSFIQFSVADLLVPFRAEWKPAPVALGIVAMWLVVTVQLTSLARRRLPKTVWRGVHVTSYVAFWCTSLHSALAGTDRTQPLYVATSVVAVAATMFALLYRVLLYRVLSGPRRPRATTASVVPTARAEEPARHG